MNFRVSSLLMVTIGVTVATLFTAFSASADKPENVEYSGMPTLQEYSVSVKGNRKNHRTTIGLKDPTTVKCPFCGVETDDITRVVTTADGSAEIPCETYQYGCDILYHYADLYQAICHNCSPVEKPEDSALVDQVFSFNQKRTLIFCEGHSHV